MATLISNKGQRKFELGEQVTRAAAVLPASGVSTPYFTVTGGRVIITSLVGKVTAVNDAQLTTLKFSAVPSNGGTANNMSAVSASLANAEIGSHLSLDGVIATALQYTATSSGAVGAMTKYQVVQAGTIDAVTATATAPATCSWELTYVPLDDGAYVTST